MQKSVADSLTTEVVLHRITKDPSDIHFCTGFDGSLSLHSQGKRVALSGSGNVATYAVQKLLELGAVPVTLSDSAGFVYWKDGITSEQLEAVMHLKNVTRGRLSDLKDSGAHTSPPLSSGCAWCVCMFRVQLRSWNPSE